MTVKDILEIVYDTEPLYLNQMNQTRIGLRSKLDSSSNIKHLRMVLDLGMLILTDFKPLSLLRNQQ
jgi:hypothetical protein